MKKNLLLLALLLAAFCMHAQEDTKTLPIGFAPGEEILMPAYLQNLKSKTNNGITDPPPTPPRSIAEWEELQAISLTWTSFEPLLAEIIRHAREEVEVIVVTSNVSGTQAQLQNIYGFTDFENITFIEDEFDSIWMRDYGGNPAYLNDVESLVMVDWIYNRPRPDDDDNVETIAEYLDIPLYQTTECPLDLVHTGGNYMTDGIGMGFSSKLVLDENSQNAIWNDCPATEGQIDTMMYAFLGIEEYPKMENLPYDGIHHIDMHMKLLDEETLLVGRYPDGVSDGPQIEANLAYILDNFTTSFGTPFNVIRIDMPPDAQGDYPGSSFGNSDYFTYTNALFVNKTVLVPIYMTEHDEPALEIWRAALPGYNIVGLDCRDIIQYGGAIHCITKEIGVEDPLWIAHEQLRDVPGPETDGYTGVATIKHRSGIAQASLWYKTDLAAAYEEIDMFLIDATTNQWAATIPMLEPSTTVYYYIDATANSGKSIARPMPAPEGYFDFYIGDIVSTENLITSSIKIDKVFPNPSNGTTYINIESGETNPATIIINDLLGRQLFTAFDGYIDAGQTTLSFDSSRLMAGMYVIELNVGIHKITQKIVIK